MLKQLQLTFLLLFAFITLCISAIVLNLYTWNLVAHRLGYNTEIYYRGYVSACNRSVPNEKQREFRRIYDQYETQIKNGESFPEKKIYDTLDAGFKADTAWIDLLSEGIFALFSFTGLTILWINRKRIEIERKSGQLKLFTWLFVLIALYCHWFIMDFVFKLIEVNMGVPLEFNAWITWLAHNYHISGWIFLSFNCLVSLIVLAYTAFRIVPRRQLMPFLIAGLAGGVLSRLIWYSLLGSIVMPHP